MSYSPFLQKALSEASEIATSYFGKTTAIAKEGDNNQVLTEADLQVGKYIVTEIEKEFPEHNIIDEEAGVLNKKSDFTWVIDPIDGTSNFAAGTPNYGIIIGLLHLDQPIAGGVALPFFKEITTAEKEKGAFCSGKKLAVTQESSLLSSLVAYAIDGHQENANMTYDECKILADIVLGIRNLRASGSIVDGMMVAKGKYGAYLNRTSKIWDNVGQHIIIEEAGGVYTDFFGKPMDYSNPFGKAKQNFTWCIGSPTLHKQLQEIIHST
ncbi:MAG: inositol monophosphatase family protein [Candidatus Levyibacteriota bacterium]